MGAITVPYTTSKWSEQNRIEHTDTILPNRAHTVWNGRKRQRDAVKNEKKGIYIYTYQEQQQ